MTSAEFLAELWGSKPPGFILIWDLDSKRSSYVQTPGRKRVPLGAPDIYTGTGLAAQNHGRYKRTPNDQVVGIAGLWADIDVDGGADRKAGAHPTWDDAAATAMSLAEPTILVHSGYGLHAWWLFDGGPWRFRTRGDQRTAARLSAQWQALLRSRSGFGLDYTHDLSRLLRLPGTDNCKRGRRKPVEAIEWGGPRHERDELLEIAAAAGDVSPGYVLGDSAEVRLRSASDADHRIAETLIRRSPQFARLWRHQRELPSMSEYDFALGWIVALAGGSDQQIADVITAHRAVHNDPKGARPSYLLRTVGKIRAGAGMRDAA